MTDSKPLAAHLPFITFHMSVRCVYRKRQILAVIHSRSELSVRHCEGEEKKKKCVPGVTTAGHSTVNTVPSSHAGHRQLRLSSVKMNISHTSEKHLEIRVTPQEFPP